VVIMGDTCNSEHIVHIAMDADVLIHEATNSWIPEMESVNALSTIRNYRGLERETISHGHSTSVMAGAFASRIRAKRLVLTHFSSKYPGDDSASSSYIMRRIENQAESSAAKTAEALNQTYFAQNDVQSAQKCGPGVADDSASSAFLLHKPLKPPSSHAPRPRPGSHSLPPQVLALQASLATTAPYFTPHVTAAYDNLVVPVPIEARNLSATRPKADRQRRVEESSASIAASSTASATSCTTTTTSGALSTSSTTATTAASSSTTNIVPSGDSTSGHVTASTTRTTDPNGTTLADIAFPAESVASVAEIGIGALSLDNKHPISSASTSSRGTGTDIYTIAATTAPSNATASKKPRGRKARALQAAERHTDN
jgi:hypothetical protein